MKCSRHPQNDAVAQCSLCNDYLCSDCFEQTKHLKSTFGTVCLDCYEEILQADINNYQWTIKNNIKKTIISIVLYIIGVILIVAAFLGETSAFTQQYTMIGIGVFLCGFYTALQGIKEGERAHREQERKEGVTYVVDSDGNIRRKKGFLLKLIYFVVFCILGVIVTPIAVIKAMVENPKIKKLAESTQKELEEIQQM